MSGGILLTPPPGTAERALRCETDHAPLRRLNHREYTRTLRDLFSMMTLPDLNVIADGRRSGFMNNVELLTPSSLLVTQYFENAERISALAAPVIVSELGCADAACFEGFIADFGARAYRRPLTASEQGAYASLFRTGPLAGQFALAIEFAIQTFLQAPEFIYRPEFGGDDATLAPYEVASRLSYFLWGTMPDEALFTAAREGHLQGTTLESEVNRMLRDPRAREGLVTASTEWLDVDRLADRMKAESFQFTPEVRAHLRTSLEMFLWDRVFNEEDGLDALYGSTGAYVDTTIGPLFGVTDATPTLTWRELPHRHGVLTHPAILAIHGHGTYGSPVLRGVFTLTEILCDPPNPPPPGTAMSPPPAMDETGRMLSNREGYEALTQRDPACSYCHNEINPLGFALESYDTVGAYREQELGRPIDTSGSMHGFTLATGYTFANAEELTSEIGADDRARACVVDRWVRYAAGGGALAYDPCWRRDLLEVATRPGVSLRDLVIAIALSPRFVASEVVE